MGDGKEVTLRYVAPFFCAWGDIELQSPLGQPALFKVPQGNPGVCLVFDSMEALKAAYPGVDESNVLVFPLEPQPLPPNRCRHCGGKNTVRCIHCRKVY